MQKDDVLVIKCNAKLNSKGICDLLDTFVNMKAQGVVIVPNYCDVVIAPKDIKIKVEHESVTGDDMLKMTHDEWLDYVEKTINKT